MVPSAAAARQEALAWWQGRARSTWRSSTARCRTWTALDAGRRRSAAHCGSGLPLVLRHVAGAGARSRRAMPRIAAYLTKPVKPSTLFDALATVFEPLAASAARPSPTAPPRSTPSWPAAGRCASCWPRTTRSTRSWRCGILAAAGLRADVAGNGLEVLAALERQPYDAGADGRADAGDGRPRGHRARSAARWQRTGSPTSSP